MNAKTVESNCNTGYTPKGQTADIIHLEDLYKGKISGGSGADGGGGWGRVGKGEYSSSHPFLFFFLYKAATIITLIITLYFHATAVCRHTPGR